MDAQKFGQFLQEHRKLLGLTQSQLAEKLHVTDKAVSRWERGVGLPDINLLEPLADALNLSLTELIRSEKIDTDTLAKDTADAALADTLALAEKRRRNGLIFFAKLLIFYVELYFVVLIIRFVDISDLKLISLFLVYCCFYLGNQAVIRIIDPDHKTHHIYTGWKTWIKELLFALCLLLYIVIFRLQSKIGLQACAWLALALTAVLAIWCILGIRRFVRRMPDGQ